MIDTTAYNATEYWQARGSLSPQEWRFLKNSFVQNSTIVDYFRIQPNSTNGAKSFNLEPAPGSGTSFVYEYISANWVRNSANTTGKTKFTNDNDTHVFDDLLFNLGFRYYLRREYGLDFSVERQDYMKEANRVYAQDVPRRRIRLGGEPLAVFNNIPEVGFGS